MAPPFARSRDFDARCGIHADLRGRGLPGCAYLRTADPLGAVRGNAATRWRDWAERPAHSGS